MSILLVYLNKILQVIHSLKKINKYLILGDGQKQCGMVQAGDCDGEVERGTWKMNVKHVVATTLLQTFLAAAWILFHFNPILPSVF